MDADKAVKLLEFTRRKVSFFQAQMTQQLKDAFLDGKVDGCCHGGSPIPEQAVDSNEYILGAYQQA
jgi:hypothetical protein